MYHQRRRQRFTLDHLGRARRDELIGIRYQYRKVVVRIVALDALGMGQVLTDVEERLFHELDRPELGIE